MKKIRATFRLVLVLCLALFGGQITHAAPPVGYIGFSLGSANDDVLSESDTGYKFYGGYTVNNNLGFEIAFVDLGQYVGRSLDQYGVAFEAVGYIPLSNNLDLMGKVGLFAWTVEDRYYIDYGTDLTYGLGVQYDLNNRVYVRGEWEQFTDVSGGDVSLLSAGLVYKFY